MVVAQRENFNSHLTSEINSLSDLNNVLNEIQRITDMEIRIDNLYAPVESLYDVLTRYVYQKQNVFGYLYLGS